jgi:hypothetical protein
MARIRTIKPEFAQSESMGRVSRDARLAFILMWPIADDTGRLRGNSRMLASILFPYDDDAASRIDDWLGELEREHCIRRYSVNGDAYVEVLNWKKHQKIDRPSQPIFPSFDDASPSPREASRAVIEGSALEGKGRDQGPRTKDQGQEWSSNAGKVRTEVAGTHKKTRAPDGSRLSAAWALPDDWRHWAAGERPDLDITLVADEFRDYWAAKTGRDATKADWQATWRNWIRHERGRPGYSNGHAAPSETTYQRTMRERMEEAVPRIARKAPGVKPTVIVDVEAHHVTPRTVG